MAGGRLALAREPRLTSMPLLPGHRVLRVHLRNDGDEPVVLRRIALRLLDAAGHQISSRWSSRSSSRSIRCMTSLEIVPWLRSSTIAARWASSTSRTTRW